MYFYSAYINILLYAQPVSTIFSKKLKKYSEKSEQKLTNQKLNIIIGEKEVDRDDLL